MSEAPPQLIADRYRLVEPLGQGGMGRVWRARDEVLHRDVAIKELVPPPGLTTDERREMRERSLREARAIARLNNINVVRVFDVLRTDADPWIVMEYVRSRSLQDALAADGPVSPGRAAEIGLGVLGALKAAHKAGVMHRDIKPGNVLLGEDGRVVLTDFGLATVPGDPNVTRTGLVLGSPAYIAPERARDGTAGPEADLWSLGATLYAAVEGQSPYARSSAIATLAALATEPPPPAKRAGPLKAVLNGLLRKDPAQRITADVAERLLRRAADKRPRGAISLLDGVRRPSPYGPREARTRVVPLPAQRQPARPAEPAESSSSSIADFIGTAGSGPAVPVVPAAAAAAETAVPERSAEDQPDVDGTPTAAEPTVVASSPADPDEHADSPASPVDKPGSTADKTAKVDAPATSPSAADSSTAVAAVPVPDRDEPALVAAAPTEVVGGASRGSTFGPFKPRPESGDKGPFLNKQRMWLVGGLVAVLLIALVVVIPLATRDSDDGRNTAQTGGEPSPSASASAPAATTAPAVPPPAAAPTTEPAAPPSSPAAMVRGEGPLPTGWIWHKDPTGFTVPVPAGWRVQRNRTSVEFLEPNGARMLMIDQTSTPQPDAVADWKRQEEARVRAGRYRNYKQVVIKKIDYFLEAADWEWTYTSSNGNPLHVVNRGFVTGPKHGYAIYWSTPAAAWQDNLDELQLISDGFLPAPN
ncbi:serine/threonine-protein kinase [Micromonospora sp. NBC_01796]|uniref:serine/threonine-protein kinase n=1 Tax=Micromonospora sp. NBC_01796 TaxID=2975987 RepID=UPI002DD80660|nr:protein kinase [Micromonospora sp. NBC_01796]WSA89275.1 protein kinase [Micromonospora sp. NBC_01796]